METNRTWLLGERVLLDQKTEGYRAGLDAVLLAASLRLTKGDERLLDVGCGAGGALLCAAWRCRSAHFTGIERDADMLQLARSNIVLNDFVQRVDSESGDASVRPDALLNAFDHVFSNPPYFRPDAIQDVHPDRAGAYLADVSLEDWFKFMLHTVRPRGRITVIHRAGELARILSFLDPRFGEIEVLPVRPKAGVPAKRVIVTARKGLRRGETLLHDGLTLYNSKGELTERAKAVQSGGALEWI